MCGFSKEIENNFVNPSKRYDQKRDVCHARNGDKNNGVLLGCGSKMRINLRSRKY